MYIINQIERILYISFMVIASSQVFIDSIQEDVKRGSELLTGPFGAQVAGFRMGWRGNSDVSDGFLTSNRGEIRVGLLRTALRLG